MKDLLLIWLYMIYTCSLSIFDEAVGQNKHFEDVILCFFY